MWEVPKNIIKIQGSYFHRNVTTQAFENMGIISPLSFLIDQRGIIEILKQYWQDSGSLSTNTQQDPIAEDNIPIPH